MYTYTYNDLYNICYITYNIILYKEYTDCTNQEFEISAIMLFPKFYNLIIQLGVANVFFFKFIYLNDFYTQHRAPTYDPEFKTRMFFRLSQPGSPANAFFERNVSVPYT